MKKMIVALMMLAGCGGIPTGQPGDACSGPIYGSNCADEYVCCLTPGGGPNASLVCTVSGEPCQNPNGN
jgi:hypothetical protein